jgi:hypothetical protein
MDLHSIHEPTVHGDFGVVELVLWDREDQPGYLSSW